MPPASTSLSLDGEGPFTVLSARSDNAKATLANIGSAPDQLGLTEGELLIALGSKRKTFDAFGIFCKVYGELMNAVGPVVVLIVSVTTLLLALKELSDIGESVVSRIKRWGTGFWTVLAIGGAIAIPGYMIYKWIFSDEEYDDDGEGTAARMIANGLYGFVLGLLPPPIAMAFNIGMGELTNNRRAPSAPRQPAAAPEGGGGEAPEPEME